MQFLLFLLLIGRRVSARPHPFRMAALPRQLPAAAFLLLLACAAGGKFTRAQEPPYFVTYSEALEEPGNLEVATKNLAGSPRDAHAFLSSTLELEYGATAWWTSELYLQGQTTAHDSTLFTGFRWENRFRALPTEHWLNPVLYVEYEDVNGADKSILEVTGHDGIGDLQAPNGEARHEISRTMEGKLILSSNARGWNFSENWIMEKNLMGGAWEYGYAAGVSRPLTLRGDIRNCVFCWQNIGAGAEVYGGLATVHDFGLRDTSHYAGPAANLNLPHGPTVSFSPQFGLNRDSVGVLWRFDVSCEVQQLRDLFHEEAE